MHTHLPALSPVSAYEAQAEQILRGHQSGDSDTLRLIHQRHPRFLDPKVPLKMLPLTQEDIRSASFPWEDARLAVARFYDFLDWAALERHAGAASVAGSPLWRFESAIDAVVDGDADALRRLLAADPHLVHARSERITHFDPPVHRATLLHYIAANGVEGFRQKTPQNAVEIARTLLEAGADPNSLADCYGSHSATLGLLVSSCHPANAGLQGALAELLVAHGAALDAQAVATALVFGYRDTAETLVKLGAEIDLITAAGLGRFADTEQLLPAATPESRHRALALAAQLGQVETLRLLLDAGEDPNRLNPKGLHAHSTPLHQAVWAEQEGTVRLLLDRGARTDIRDNLWDGTPLDWARHGEKKAMEALLLAHGSR